MNLGDIKALPQWVGHQHKIPKDPHTGKNASSTDPATWAVASTAWQAKKRAGWDGIGFVFTIESGIVGVDLDDCFEDRKLKPWANDIVQCLNSYTELSPSGAGLHILCCGSIPYSITKNKLGFEMYNEARYFTVTGNMLGGFAPIIEERNKELAALHVVYSDEPRAADPPETRVINQRVSKAEVEKALAVIPVHQDYLDWLRCLMAVHDAFPDGEGVALIEAWSPGTRGEVARKFRSFDRTSKDGTTIATLFHMAKQYGYRPPAAVKKVNKTGKRTHSEKIQRLMAI